MEARAPAVVAVVVARDPGPWFEETLRSLARQDYEELSVLVLVPEGGEDPTARVAREMPEAFVRTLPDDRGFGPSVNETLTVVDGAAFFLVCHDDVALAPDAVHLLVEESFRSNAGIVSPKFLDWDDPRMLLHVGRSADKIGSMVDRVHPGEVDHGQHDAVRDVFVAPGGCTLIRADLFTELEGFDPEIPLFGEDLDFCWRAQVAGSRVVIAPDAEVRHREALSNGARAQSTPVEPPRTKAALQRRHELRTVLKCYGPWHRLRVLPQILVLWTGELLVALLTRDRARSRSILGALHWNFSRRAELRRTRAALQKLRRVPDGQVRTLQTRGSARLSIYLTRLVHQGFDAAHGRVPALGHHEEQREDPELTGSVGRVFAEDSQYDELDDLGQRRARRRPGGGFLTSRRSRAIGWTVVAVLLVVGTRELFDGSFPLVGQLIALPDWGSTWHHFVSGWQPAGVGTTAPATPAFAFLGAVGTVLIGGMGLVEKVLVLGCIPVGAWGVSRFLRPLGSPRSRFVAAVAYLGLPLAYGALSQGRWDGLVAYAATPWICSLLARSSGIAPFGAGSGARFRESAAGIIVVLAVVEAVAMAFAPAMIVVVALVALANVAGSLVFGQRSGAGRTVVVAVLSAILAVVLDAPWALGTLLAGRRAIGVLGLTVGPWSGASWTEITRFAIGPIGHSWLSWLLVAAALLPLLIGRHERLAWAGRLWILTCLSWLLAWAVTQGWTSPFSPSVTVVLAPAAVGVASCVGLGVVAFERDLSGYLFGWRQAATGIALVVAAAGLLPVVVGVGDGRWGLPRTGYAQPLSWLSKGPQGGGFRALWLGDPRSLPGGGWSIEPGLAYSTSENGVADADDLWAPAGPGPADRLAQAVQLALDGSTTHLGQLLAQGGVRYVVVLDGLAPSGPGVQHATAFPPPRTVVSGLLAQTDLRQIPGGEGFSVFESTDTLPERAHRTTPLPVSPPSASPRADLPTAADVVGWHGVLAGPPGSQAFHGPVPTGTIFSSFAPAGRWSLTSGGRSLSSQPVFGWAGQFPTAPAGRATLRFEGTPLVPVGVTAEVVLWLVVLWVLVAPRRWRRERRPRRRDGRPRTAVGDGGGTGEGAGAEEVPAAEPGAHSEPGAPSEAMAPVGAGENEAPGGTPPSGDPSSPLVGGGRSS